MNNQYMRHYTNSIKPQHIEKRLADESKQLDLDNRYELIRIVAERIQQIKG